MKPRTPLDAQGIDLKLLRDDPDVVRRSQLSRGEDPALVDVLLAADGSALAATAPTHSPHCPPMHSCVPITHSPMPVAIPEVPRTRPCRWRVSPPSPPRSGVRPSWPQTGPTGTPALKA